MKDDNIAKTDILRRLPIQTANKGNGGDGRIKPNINDDKVNLLKLMFLYTLQGVPYGFADVLPIILKTKQFSYNDQAIFSMSTWPFTFKILWAPLVDTISCFSIGRRKMWIIPVYLQLGICLLFCSWYISEWMDAEYHSNVILLTILWLIINCLAATQDIVVDGWACSMLQKHNIHYASMCNATGNSLGSFMGYVVTLLLGSEEFCNTWLRSQPKSGSIITLDGYLYCWGIVYIVASAFVFMFKSETEPSSEHKSLGVWNTYKLLWNILKLPNVQLLGIIWITAKLGFATVDSATNMEFMGAGVSENSIALLGILLYLVKIIVPMVVSKMIDPTDTLVAYLKYIPYRLIHGLVFAVLLYYTPLLINGSVTVQTFYYGTLGLTYATYQTCMFIMYVLYLSFLSQVSDPNYGGVYMTLLGTFANLSYAVTRTGSLWLIDILTVKRCSTVHNNYCETSKTIKYCEASDGMCNTIIGGYYTQIALSSMMGILWYYLIKGPMVRLQSSDKTNWIVYKKENRKMDQIKKTIY